MPSKSPCVKRPGKAKSLFRDSRECGRCAGYLCDPAILVLVYASACPSVMHVNTLCELATAMHRQQYCIRKELIYVGENIFTNSLLCSIFKDWLSECSSSSLNITGLPDAAWTGELFGLKVHQSHPRTTKLRDPIHHDGVRKKTKIDVSISRKQIFDCARPFPLCPVTGGRGKADIQKKHHAWICLFWCCLFVLNYW